MAAIDKLATVLTRKQVAHLLRRTTFGPTISDIDSFTGRTVDEVVEVLFEDIDVPNPPVDLKTGEHWLPKPVEDINSDGNELQLYFLSWWLHQMKLSRISCKEKLVFFLHTHITTIASVVRSTTALYYQNSLFRHYAFGSFKELAYKICFDNAMLAFLDGKQNQDGNPQENFAREFLELYTIGKGEQVGPGDYSTFTEEDVRECAKIFSGYVEDPDFATIDPDTGLPTGKMRGNGVYASRHDASTKTLSSAFDSVQIAPDPATVVDGKTTIEAAKDEVQQLVDVIFEQEETAKHICRKVYRFFCYYTITEYVETNVIEPLAQTFIANDFSLEDVVKQLISSQHFFDSDNSVEADDLKGAIIKSPLDLVMGIFRMFKVDFPDYETETEEFYKGAYQSVYDMLSDQGLNLYEPYEVAGYPAYHQFPGYNRNWISANYLGYRYHFSAQLVQGIKKFGDDINLQFDIVAFVEDELTHVNVADAEELVQEFVDVLLPEAITPERFNYFLHDILLDDLPINNWPTEWSKYQVSGDDMVVRMQLEALFLAITQSPEFQLM